MPDAYYDRMSTINDTDSDASFQGRVLAWKVAWSFATEHFPIGAGFDGPQQTVVFNHYIPGAAFHAAHSIYFEVLGDNGFIGLAIFITILALAFINCSKIRKATRGKPELQWARDLATMIQLSLVAYCVGGSALSLAYYDMFYIWALVLPPLLIIVQQQVGEKAKEPAIRFRPLAPQAAESRHYASVTDTT
jgi:probable O-glycosylation ligase (exosortase A-associated)